MSDNDWKNLPTWREAKEKGFPLYRATNDSYMEKVKKGGNTFSSQRLGGKGCCLICSFLLFFFCLSYVKMLPYLEQFSYVVKTEKVAHMIYMYGFASKIQILDRNGQLPVIHHCQNTKLEKIQLVLNWIGKYIVMDHLIQELNTCMYITTKHIVKLITTHIC